jgi:hypothetical protein
MALVLGDSKNVIVGAAQIFIEAPATPGTPSELPTPQADESYAVTLSDDTTGVGWRNLGYTNNGLELQFQPEFGEVKVDQILDAARLFKSGMQVTLNTSMAEATLENLLVALAAREDDYTEDAGPAGSAFENDSVTAALQLNGGSIGECPVERQLIAVGPGPGGCVDGADQAERVYVANRVLSIDNVSISAKRDEATTFDVSFRLLPNDEGMYGMIVDRTFTAGGPSGGTS